MKAIICTRSGLLRPIVLKEIAKPIPKDDEVLIKIYAASITSIDMGFRRSIGTGNGEARPHKLGHYYAGVVEAAGGNVKRFKKNDQVYGGDVWSAGALAEYICVRENNVIVKKPAKMSYEEAAALTYGGLTALPFLRDAGKVRKGQNALIIGASGSIGTYAIQLAKYYGAKVTGACSTKKIDTVKVAGADDVIDYTKEDFTKNGKTYDIIFDTPGKSSFSRCRNSLTQTGKYLTTVPWPGVLLQMLWTSFAGRKKAIFRPMGLRSTRKKIQDLEFLNELYESGKIKPVIDRVFTLEETADAYHYIAKGKKQGNIIIAVKSSR